MLVVMDTGYAYKPDAPLEPSPNGGTPRRVNAFEDLMVDDLIPMIDSTYRTIADRDHRAMAGLSMGGMQSLQITSGHLDKFAWIGSFSGPVRNFDIKTSHNGEFSDPASFNKKVRLLWIGAGTAEEAIHKSVATLHEALENAGVKHVYYESQGTAHEWLTWRRDLNEFVPRLFH
jgi:enterochelin esterase family protein